MSQAPGSRVRIGTRGSDLALWQARAIREALQKRWGESLEVELTVITTEGDRIVDRPLYEVGGKGLFVKALEEKLLDGGVDLAVHSMKDLPSRLPDGLVIACTPTRGDPRDVLVGPEGTTLAGLPAGARIGTTSLRRAALARRINAGLEVVPIRGNVPTRLAKLDAGEVDALVLAAAGLERLGLADRIAEHLDVERFCPAACQGILAVECRTDDTRILDLIGPLADHATTIAARTERAFLARLEGGCTIPIGCHAEVAAERLFVRGVVADPTGRPCFLASKVGAEAEAERLGTRLADSLLALGAGSVIEALSREQRD